MQYSLDYLTPLSIRFDEEATAYVVYRLPAPKRWQFRTYLSGPNFDDYTETEQEVSRVRVSLVIDEPTNEPLAIVVPFGPDGQEHAISAVTFRGIVSMVGVLAQMGFEMVVLNRTVFLLNFRCYGKSNQTKPHPSQVRQVL